MTQQGFNVGVNYLPVRSAQLMWRQFDAAEVRDDFDRIREHGFRPVRIFLFWEDFQRDSSKVNLRALDKLAQVASYAMDKELDLWISLFVGYLMDVNWLPLWLLEPAPRGGDTVFLGGSHPVPFVAADLFRDPELVSGQKKFIREAASALRGYPRLFCWELGSQWSKLCTPEDPTAVEAWFLALKEELRGVDEATPITIGIGVEDFQREMGLSPHFVAEHCDLVSIDLLPPNINMSKDPKEITPLAFMVSLTRWLCQGKGIPVWVEAFGLPTGSIEGSLWAVDEEDAAVFAQNALQAFYDMGATGALWWCYADFHPRLMRQFPFWQRPWWGRFGLFSTDGRPKAMVEAIMKAPRGSTVPCGPSLEWWEMEMERYWQDPRRHMEDLYRRFKEEFPCPR